MGYRSSLYCWPLLAEKADDQDCQKQPPNNESTKRGRRGLSLPIALFLVRDGKSTHKSDPNYGGQKVWMGYQYSKKEEKPRVKPKFNMPDGALPGHIYGYRFGFTWDWWKSLRIGVDVAKKLWVAQNGRLRFADDVAADAILTSSLNVDLRAACDIVESVFSRVPDNEWRKSQKADTFFTVSDRSAEAYWVQCVLGLLLPSREVPLGLCTGKIEYLDGEFEMQEVDGVVAKLEYANRAGVPRVVLPGDRREYVDEDEESEIGTEVKEFLERVRSNKSRKTIEINFSRTARAAADAMQASGWRRTSFLRVPDFQRAFGHNQRRLFLRDALKDKDLRRRIKPREKDWYNSGKVWWDIETKQLENLDKVFLSNANRSVKYVYRNQIPAALNSAEEAVGKWLAWKDNQIRAGEQIESSPAGYRGPGLGILAMRTAEGDNEIRLWAALAEMLDVDENWWERFQWSGLSRSADMLAQLLCNQRADPTIGTGSAPDLLVIFDDGALTQSRTNQVFPSDYNHQFFDLLNPRHPENKKTDFLDAALKQIGIGALHHPTRIIVILGESSGQHDPDAVEIDSEDRNVIEKLSIFRYGFSRQAAFSMLNFGDSDDGRVSWLDFELTIDRLLDKNLLRRSRNSIFVPDAVRRHVRETGLQDDPQAHLHAARALCPILQPHGSFIAGNRDRQLEPENVLEASWHLERAASRFPYRFRQSDKSIDDALALFTLLRTSPDWDTVKKMRGNRLTREESVKLGRELVELERKVTGSEPHPSRIGLYIETLGKLYKNVAPGIAQKEVLADEIVAMVDHAINAMKAESIDPTDWKRRLRFLFSRQIFAFRMLELSLTDPRLAGGRGYIENAITDALDKNFISSLGDNSGTLRDFPISYDFWRCMWKDEKRGPSHLALTEGQRSTYAYAAARTNLGQASLDKTTREAWDEPWIGYFSLTKAEEFSPAQVSGPLLTWRNVCGKTSNDALSFGRRVLDMQPHAVRPKAIWKENWLLDIFAACSNLWTFATHLDDSKRLVGLPVSAALDLIRVIALQETLPAYCFLNSCDPVWLDHWPVIATGSTIEWPDPAKGTFGPVTGGWKALARDIVTNSAGWVMMLASLDSLADDRHRIARVRAWLEALENFGTISLHHADPEKLLQRARSLLSIQSFNQAVYNGRSNAKALLELRKDGSWMLLPVRYRNKLDQIRSELRVQAGETQG